LSDSPSSNAREKLAIMLESMASSVIGAQRRHRSRLLEQPGISGAEPHPTLDLARVDRSPPPAPIRAAPAAANSNPPS
jgi:hypothetical protein